MIQIRHYQTVALQCRGGVKVVWWVSHNSHKTFVFLEEIVVGALSKALLVLQEEEFRGRFRASIHVFANIVVTAKVQFVFHEIWLNGG